MFNMFNVNVYSSVEGGLSPEEWAELATNKIITVGSETEGPIRDQAIAYRGRIKKVIEYYIKQAVLSNEKHLLARK